MINNIAIVDTETTDVLPDNGRVIEIAAILYNVPSRTILQQISTLLPFPDAPRFTNKAYHVNKIPQSVLELSEYKDEPKEFIVNEYPYEDLILAFISLTTASDYIVAHNAEFDKQWLIKTTKERNDFDFNLEKPWICSCHDFKWPEDCNGAKKLTDIALSLEVPVVSAHRALTDCQLLANCFSKLTDLESRLEDATKPRHVYISSLPFEKNDINKAHGFQWDKLVPKKWAKKLTEEEAAALPFNTYKA